MPLTLSRRCRGGGDPPCSGPANGGRKRYRYPSSILRLTSSVRWSRAYGPARRFEGDTTPAARHFGAPSQLQASSSPMTQSTTEDAQGSRRCSRRLWPRWEVGPNHLIPTRGANPPHMLGRRDHRSRASSCRPPPGPVAGVSSSLAGNRCNRHSGPAKVPRQALEPGPPRLGASRRSSQHPSPKCSRTPRRCSSHRPTQVAGRLPSHDVGHSATAPSAHSVAGRPAHRPGEGRADPPPRRQRLGLPHYEQAGQRRPESETMGWLTARYTRMEPQPKAVSLPTPSSIPRLRSAMAKGGTSS
jgi:hypothetical protein